jgi:DNA-binding FadR family transcriptional regulator
MGDEPVVHGGDLVGLLSQSPSRWLIAHYSRSARIKIRAAPRRQSLVAAVVELQGEGGSGSDVDLALHLEIARASHDTYILQVLEFLSGSMRVTISRSRELDVTRSESLANAYAEHAAIFNAIVAGDADAAVRAMRSHLEAGQRRLLFRPT